MIDIPLNKVIEVIESSGLMSDCNECVFKEIDCAFIYCSTCKRKDGKNVIFKLVDLPCKETANG